MTGYLSEVNQRDLDRYPERYAPRDRIGRSGVERAFERELRGTWGKRYRMYEALEPGGPLMPFPVPGRDDEDTEDPAGSWTSPGATVCMSFCAPVGG